jgi:hypothetical protein
MSFINQIILDICMTFEAPSLRQPDAGALPLRSIGSEEHVAQKMAALCSATL